MVGVAVRVRVGRQLVVENPTPCMLEWAKRRLTLPNPDYAKKVRMGFWLGNTPKTLALYEMRGKAMVLPFGLISEINDTFDLQWLDAFPTPPRIDFGGCDVDLYDYQQIAVERMYRAKYGILVSPAGSGKTQMGIALVKKYARPALWLTHTADLLKQSRDRAARYMDESLIGTITQGKVNIGAGITFATVQTMAKMDLRQYEDMWDVVIVDECHHCASSPTAMTQFGKVVSNLAARHKYGLTATAHRSDGLMSAVYAMLGPIKYTVPDEAVKERIMRVGLMPVFTHVQNSPLAQNPDGTLNYTKMIRYLCEHGGRNRIIADAVADEVGRSCLILSERVEHLETIRGLLPKIMRDESALITGKMTSKSGRAERENAVQAMRDGKLKYLFATYQLAKEGLDIPRLERLFLTTPVKDKAVVIQAIGRVARTHEGKQDPMAIDFVDEIRYCENAYRQRLRIYKKLDMII